jgi:RimJ/RimL family protein N-acetyltransferase
MPSEKIISTNIGAVKIRSYQERDIGAHMKYLYDSDNSLLARIGFDLSKFPGKERHSEFIRSRVSSSNSDKPIDMMIAEFEEEAIALVFLNTIEPANAHFHIFSPEFRGKGIGAPVFKTGIKLLMRENELDSVHIEPKATNSPMNRLMEKCGFRYIEKRQFSSNTTKAFEAKRYEIILDDL